MRASISHCPQWVKSYIDGYDRCLFEMNYNSLEFCYLLRGVLYSTHKDSDKPTTDRLYNKGLGAYIAKHGKGRHYWKVLHCWPELRELAHELSGTEFNKFRYNSMHVN